TIQDKEKHLMSPSQVIKIDKDKKYKKVVIKCNYNTDDKHFIHDYISARQMEIVKEIQCVDIL
ncbi:MAG: hypothetical protein OQJ77_02045, partial [Thiovulaceae bacterium]|nr:hypothetical protein [Sulfurimonadaceae bacterium]